MYARWLAAATQWGVARTQWREEGTIKIYKGFVELSEVLEFVTRVDSARVGAWCVYSGIWSRPEVWGLL